ncbi:hypothetical protein ACLK1T_06510 [Escherichia coli]
MSVSRFVKNTSRDRYFLELIGTGRPTKKAICTRRWNFGERRGFRRGDDDVRFIDSSDFDAHEIRVAIHDGFTLDEMLR